MTRIVSSSALTTTVSKSTLQALFTDVTPASAKQLRFDGTVKYYKKVTSQNSATDEDNLRIAFMPGQIYRQQDIDDMYPNPKIISISPSTGLAAAGGTTVTVTGSNMGGITGITFGGTAGTSFTRISDSKCTIVTPAKSAGTYDVATAGAPSGTNSTLTGGATFV